MSEAAIDCENCVQAVKFGSFKFEYLCGKFSSSAFLRRGKSARTG
nr:hypothetical protein [uncultured Campylobacter sp.]